MSVLVLAGVGCDDRQAPNGDSPAEPREPRRIATLSPDITALVVDLGLASRIVGADSASLLHPGLEAAADLGDSRSVASPAVIGLRPDLVLAIDQDPWLPFAAAVEAEGGQVHVVSPTNSNQVIAAIREIGGILGREPEADAAVTKLTDEISRIATARDGAATRRLSVVWILQRDPLLVVGSEGMLHEILELAGGEIAFHALYGEKLEVTLEAIVAIEPDLILDSTPQGHDRPIVIGARYEALPADVSQLPTLDLLERIRFLHGVLYPR